MSRISRGTGPLAGGHAPSTMRRLACLAVAGLVGWCALGPRASAAEDSVPARYDRRRPADPRAILLRLPRPGGEEGGRGARRVRRMTTAARNAPKLWHAVLKNVRAGIMPPADKPQPSAEERRLLEDWIKYGRLRDRPERPRPGPRHGPPAQPGRVPQHDPRPDRRRLRHHVRVPAGRHGPRLRQHRRRPDALAPAAGEVPRRRPRRSSSQAVPTVPKVVAERVIPGRSFRRDGGGEGRGRPGRRCPTTSRRRSRRPSTSSTTASTG